MSKTPSLREKLLVALIAGEEISAAEFARKTGTSATTVTCRLRGFADLLHRRDVSGGPGNHRVIYTAANVHALQEKLDEDVHARAGITRPRLGFDDLLNVWGIAVKHLDLPARVHCMMPAEEGLLEGILK